MAGAGGSSAAGWGATPGQGHGQPGAVAGWRTARAIEDQENNMSRRNLCKLTAAETASLARLSDSVVLS